MQITAIADVGPGSVSITDTSTEVNLDIPDDISFTADYNSGDIEISYMHDFAGNLTLSTSSIRWLPF